jgi:Choline/ethanolamine kinase
MILPISRGRFWNTWGNIPRYFFHPESLPTRLYDFCNPTITTIVGHEPWFGNVEESLAYATLVLHCVMLPIHRYSISLSSSSSAVGDGTTNAATPTTTSSSTPTPTLLQWNCDASGRTTYCYRDMVQLYRAKYDTYLRSNNPTTTKLQKNGPTAQPMTVHNNDKLQPAIDALEGAIERLEQTVAGKSSSDALELLTPVLCHMDCQPQNMIFAKDISAPVIDGGDTSLSSSPSATTTTAAASRIVSVLDWEEAALADPRFELLMLGRKVCANAEQAKAIWHMYQQAMHIDLGDIEPWLYLETVHSLTTLLLQATAGGGRSPWESQPDLVGKIERELQRLDRWNLLPL